MASKASSSSSRGTNRRVQVENVGGEPSATMKPITKILDRVSGHFFSASITIFGEVDLDIGRNLSVDTY